MVTLLGGACPGGVGSVPGTSCLLLEVAAPDEVDLRVELRVTEPDPLALALGTVVLGSGGGGEDFYADLPDGDLLVGALADAGWRVVDRRWESGWFTTGTSVKQQSRRYALLLEWIDQNLHDQGALAVSGNSGGAAEIGYALTTWGQAARIDVAVPSSGPVMSRLDYLCAAVPPPAWATQCPLLVPPGALSCGARACSDPTAPVCPFVDPEATPEELEQDSVLHSGAQLDFGATSVHLVLGSDDCTTGVPQALLFESLAQSPVSHEFVPGAPHELMSTQAGRDALVAALASAALPPEAAPPAGPVIRERVTILAWPGSPAPRAR